jgi:hypothetical protein
MIDESYDRTYQEGRAELNAGLARLFDALARRFRKTRSLKSGEMSCAPDPSPSSPSPRCR